MLSLGICIVYTAGGFPDGIPDGTPDGFPGFPSFRPRSRRESRCAQLDVVAGAVLLRTRHAE